MKRIVPLLAAFMTAPLFAAAEAEAGRALLVANHWRDYQLLDCGDGMKHERWGEFTLVRPDPQIIWPRIGGEWTNWDAWYHRSSKGGGKWDFRKRLPESWTVKYRNLIFKVAPTGFKHTGLFPEQAVNWDWCSELIRGAKAKGREISVLNLFGYTGAATVAAAAAGAASGRSPAGRAAASDRAGAARRRAVARCARFRHGVRSSGSRRATRTAESR